MLFRVFVAMWLLLAIVACKSDTPTQGGGSGAGGGSGGGGGPTTYSVGGTVSGLWGTIVLQNNGGDNLSINNNGNFTFATALANGASYNVTVHTQPSGQNCTVSNGSGNISGANVTNVAVSCVNLPYTVGGSVWGLSGTLVLQNNGGDNVTLNGDGGFSFPNPVLNSETYDVTVLTNPSGQVCHVRDNQGTIAGANVTNITVHCFSHTSSSWTQDAYLKASNAAAWDAFGRSVAISGSTIVVGANFEDSNQTTITNTDGEPTSAMSNDDASNSGAVYVFKRDVGGNWSQDAYLKASNTESGDGFGKSVAISGSTIVVVATGEDSSQTIITNNDGEPTSAMSNNSAGESGAVYVFKRDASGNWVQDAYLKASNAEGTDFFGASVAISGSTIVVGADGEDSNATTINNNDGHPTSAMSNNSASDSGAVYVFKRDGSGNWIQDAYLKASNAGANDEFGYSVAISGSTVVVAAWWEDSNVTMIDNDDNKPTSAMSNNSASNAGAVYVFKRDAGGNWIQDAYLKASNAESDDKFGWSVAISGSTIVVGAINEDSDQASINNTDGQPTTSNNSAPESGAVYVFKAF
ncbi:MAG: FG-GAP repeat protein [Turneriella sp.]|nr:FG-GAP repeat protein [Turneriella sp.]